MTRHTIGARMAVAVTVFALLMLSACTQHDQPKPAAVARTTVTTSGTTTSVIVEKAELTGDQTAAITSDWAPQLDLAVGQPVQISSSEPIPEAGITITRTYTNPIPEGWAATLAYYDTGLGTWHAVPSALSTDRKSVSAVVRHLSLWTDITGGLSSLGHAIADAGSKAANWGYYQVGKVFDTRVDAPACAGTPAWVRATIFIGTDRNNPLLFCAGQDPSHPELLDVKVRVNRGFAFNAHLTVPTAWTYNSTFSQKPLDDALAVMGNLGATFAESLGELAAPGSVVVGPGEELSFGATEQAVRGAADPTILKLEPPSTLGFLVTTLGQLVGNELGTLADGYVAAAIAISGCAGDVKAAHDAGTWTRALLACVGSFDTAIAKQLATYLVSRGQDPVPAGKLAGTVVGKIAVYLALLGPAFSTMSYAAERNVPDSAHTVAVFAKAVTPADVTADTLRTAEVPAYCNLPAQRLVNGATTQGSPGEGSILADKSPVAFADFAGLGYRQALVEYRCNAGGVGWPEVLVLIGAQGKLLGSLELATLSDAEHSTVTSLSVAGRVAHLTWDSYQGCCFAYVHHAGDVTDTNGRLQVSNRTADYTADAVVEDISGAEYWRDRSMLKDSNVITDNQWQQLLDAKSIGLAWFGPPCIETGDTATCTFEPSLPVSGGPHPNNVITMTKDPSSGYGWRVTNLQIPSPGM